MTDKLFPSRPSRRRYPGQWRHHDGVRESLAVDERAASSAASSASGCARPRCDILAGLDEADEGTVIVYGQGIEGTSLDRAVIFQSHALLPWRTVLGTSPMP